MRTLFRLLLILFAFAPVSLIAQRTLNGTVTDENRVPIPFVQVFVKNNSDLRTETDANGNYTLQLYEGEYYLVFRATGYTEREAYVTIQSKEARRDIQLFTESVTDIDEVEIVAKHTNRGREIMLEVVKKREQINPWNYPHSTEVYIKATEEIDRQAKKKEEEGKDKSC